MTLRPGLLVRIQEKPDSPPLARCHAGSLGIVIKNLGFEDGVYSSPNMWSVLVAGKTMNFHKLDLEPVNG